MLGGAILGGIEVRTESMALKIGRCFSGKKENISVRQSKQFCKLFVWIDSVVDGEIRQSIRDESHGRTDRLVISSFRLDSLQRSAHLCECDLDGLETLTEKKTDNASVAAPP